MDKLDKPLVGILNHLSGVADAFNNSRMCRRKVDLKKSFDYEMVVQQLANLRVLEILFNFLDKKTNKNDFQLTDMDTYNI